jgi:hypothetical protein
MQQAGVGQLDLMFIQLILNQRYDRALLQLPTYRSQVQLARNR